MSQPAGRTHHTSVLRKFKGYFIAILSAISYGLIPLFIIPVKREHFSVDTTLFYRFGIAALVLFVVVLYKRESLRLTWYELGVFMLLGLCYGGGSDLLFMAYDPLTPGIASTLFFIYPIFVALTFAIFYHERVAKGTWIALIITLLGVYILSVKNSPLDIKFYGLFLALGSAVFNTMYMVVAGKAKIYHLSTTKIIFYSLVFTALYYLIKVLIRKEPVILPNFELFLNFTVFALVTTVISVSALIYAIKLIGSTSTSILGAFEPVVAVLISIMFFQEVVTKNLILGVTLILSGVIISIIADARLKNSKKTD